jgi:PAS domain-containing protein
MRAGNDIVFILSREGRVLLNNTVALEQLRLPLDSNDCWHIFRILSPGSASRWREGIRSVIGKKQPVHFTSILNTRTFEVTIVPLIDTFGNVYRMIASAHATATDCPTMEKRHRHSERFRNITESIPVLIRAYDQEGLLVFWNKELERVTGYSKSEIIASTKAGSPGSLDIATGNHIEKETHAFGKKQEQTLSLIRSKSGLDIHILWWRVSREFAVPGWTAWEVGLPLNVSDPRKEISPNKPAPCFRYDGGAPGALIPAQNDLPDHGIAKSLLLHELRTPAQSTLAVAGLLRERTDIPRDLEGIIRELEAQSRRQLETIDLFGDVMQTSQAPLSGMQRTDFCEVCTRSIKDVEGMAKSKGVGLTRTCVKHDLQIICNGKPALLRSALVNLIKNGVEACKAGESVSVHCHREKENHHLHIDNPGAIPDPVLGKLFEMYSTHGKRGGRGLGCYLASMVAAQHGGTVHATSKDNSTTVCFSIPVVDAETLNQTDARNSGVSQHTAEEC